MSNRFRRIEKNNRFLNVYEHPYMRMGFTEKGFEISEMPVFFDYSRMVNLVQVHSATIREANEIEEGTEGDGIIMFEPDILAVIQTADCTPLIFWNSDYTCAGVLHIGWQGLFKGIEKELIALLMKRSLKKSTFRFILGPAIEGSCYEVGSELYEKFDGKSYRDSIFKPAPERGKDKYLMEVKKGIVLSLLEEGIPYDCIESVKLCTYCEAERFPSYRRDKGSPHRLYSYIQLKKKS